MSDTLTHTENIQKHRGNRKMQKQKETVLDFQ